MSITDRDGNGFMLHEYTIAFQRVQALEADVAALRQELDNERSTREALDKEIAGLKATNKRLEARLALALQEVARDREWVGVHYGGVWSRKHAGGR